MTASSQPLTPTAGLDARATFISRTYGHLFLALASFVALEIGLFRSGAADRIAQALLGVPWLLVLSGFVVVGWLASRIAYRARSLPAQYSALAAYVLAKGLIFVPLLHRAEAWAPGTIAQAAQWTLLGATGLTAVVWTTRRDFSFLRSLLYWGGFLALLAIVAAYAFGFRLGTWFNLAMIALAGASILYDTDKVLHRFRGRRYVAAALSLFASIAMMFWYVLRMFTRAGR